MTTLGFSTVQLLGLVVSVILPILVDLVSKASWPGGARATIHAALTAVIGFGTSAITALNAGTVFEWHDAVILAVTSWLISTATYFKLWQGTPRQAATLNTLVKDKCDLAA